MYFRTMRGASVSEDARRAGNGRIMDTSGTGTASGAEAYGATIYDFAQTGGRFIVLTTDAAFVELLKNVLYHSLGLSRKSLLHCTRVDDLFAQLRREPAARHIVFLERTISESPLANVVEILTQMSPDVGIIILTQEVDQYTTALLVEQGAHNILTKPIAISSIIEKLAFAIAPQGRLSKLIDQGKKLLEAGTWGEALLVAGKILEQKPESAVAFMIKGDAYRGLDMPARAEEMYLNATKSAELYLAPLKRLAALYEDAGDSDKQLQFLRRLNVISPLNTQRIMRIGDLEMNGGNPQAAEEMFEQALSIAQREATEMVASLSGRIAGICKDHDPELAVRYSKRALDLKGDNLSVGDVGTLNILGIALRKQGKWREAVAEYRRVVSIIPDSPSLLYNMALAYSDGRETGKALVLMRKALALDPALPETGSNVAYNIGAVFQQAGQDGAPFFRKAYEQNPNDATLWKAFKDSQAPRRPAEPGGTSPEQRPFVTS